MSKGTEFASPFDRAKRGEIGGRQNDATAPQRHDAIAPKRDDAVAPKRDDTIAPKRDDTIALQRDDAATLQHGDAVASKRDGAEQEKSAHTSLYMSPALLRWLRRDALDRGMTMNKLVVQLITEYRERQEGSQS